METDHIEISPLKQQILDLVQEGKIKHKKSVILKSSEENLEKIYREYETKQLDEANGQLADILIKKFSELMETLETVKSASAMEKDLISNDLLRNDLKHLVGYITPYVPLIGIFSGGLTVGKHVVENLVEQEFDVTKMPATR